MLRIMNTPHIAMTARLEWISLSFGGALVGAISANHFFPSAIYGKTQTGYFDLDLSSPLMFALVLGLFFGLAQWAALRHTFGKTNVDAKAAQELWIPVTAIGITAMTLPLLWIGAVVPAVLYIAALPAMAPGIILLSMMQLALLRKMVPERSWFWRTAAGAVLGAVVGLPVARFLLHFCHVPGEISYAGTIGLFIGALQSGYIDMMSSPGLDDPAVMRQAWPPRRGVR